MDFYKENNFKKKLHPSVPHFQSKATSKTCNTTPVHSNGKGKIRIEQYEYEEENLLGQGYTSKVYLGRLIDNARSQFAIKVVDKKKISRNKENLQLLKQEIQIHKQLDHPNIVKCHQIIEKNNHYYIVLEYCPQGTLDAFIKKHEKLSESVAISIMEQIIAGYRYLLQLKILHRDLKPPNILKSGPNWKICDFGFSVMGKKNLVGEINVGTPAYMAPESLERTIYSPKTDFFSIGVLCYQMLFGVTPWQHKNEKILLQMIKDKKFSESHFNGFRNKNLISFMIKCCNANERIRMSPEEFQNFSFWKEETAPLTERQTVQLFENIRPLRKTSGTIKDFSSTCYSQSSNNTSFAQEPESRIDRNTPAEIIFKGNFAVVERDLYYATLIHNLMWNSAYMLFEEAEKKELFLTILGKHAKYITRRIKHETINYLCLKRWSQYCKDEEYKRLKKQASNLEEKVQKIMNAELKRKTIITIRHVNKKYDQLTYDQNISFTCVKNLQEYLSVLMEETIKRYEKAGKTFVLQNSWTTQVVSYLYEYYQYVKDVAGTAEQSRIIALKEEEKERSDLLEDFGKSQLGFQVFQCLANDIRSLPI